VAVAAALRLLYKLLGLLGQEVSLLSCGLSYSFIIKAFAPVISPIYFYKEG